MERVKRALPFLLTGLLVITLFVVQFVVFTPNGTADMKAFWTRLAINVFLLVTAAFIWWGGGMDQAKQEEKSAYRTNSTLYGKKVSAMADDGRLRQFREYCKQKTDELRTSKEKAQLLRVGIDRKQYEELKSLTVEELRQKGYISKQIRAIRKVREGRVKVREINPMELMTDSKARDEYDVHYDEKAERTDGSVHGVSDAWIERGHNEHNGVVDVPAAAADDNVHSVPSVSRRVHRDSGDEEQDNPAADRVTGRVRGVGGGTALTGAGEQVNTVKQAAARRSGRLFLVAEGA